MAQQQQICDGRALAQFPYVMLYPAYGSRIIFHPLFAHLLRFHCSALLCPPAGGGFPGRPVRMFTQKACHCLQLALLYNSIGLRYGLPLLLIVCLAACLLLLL